MPVWSLSTTDASGQPNMNICTYVTSISMEPKMMVVAVYHHTKTLANLKNEPRGLLQLLNESHADIVRTCGKQSGNSIAKIPRIAKKHLVQEHGGLSYLSDAAGFMELEFVEFLEVGGDHVLAVAQVINSKNLSDTERLLTTDYLKEHKIIR